MDTKNTPSTAARAGWDVDRLLRAIPRFPRVLYAPLALYLAWSAMDSYATGDLFPAALKAVLAGYFLLEFAWWKRDAGGTEAVAARAEDVGPREVRRGVEETIYDPARYNWLWTGNMPATDRYPAPGHVGKEVQR